MRRLLAFVALVALALCVGQVIEPDSLRVRRCVDVCEDDDVEGRCASDCGDCACCFHQRIMAAPQPRGLPLEAGAVVIWAADQTPASPDPVEILHIPKSLLA